MTPIISIIIPCYNHGQYIIEAINSVEELNDKSLYEIIIINDGSTDELTIKILKELTEKGYNIINQENQGLSTSRNNGIIASCGIYILPLDADDKIRPEFVIKGIEILNNNPEIGLVYGDAFYFEEEEVLVKANNYSLKRLLTKNYIFSCSLIRKEAWLQTKGYDTALSAMEDWDLNISLASMGWKFHYIPQISFYYRIRKNSMIRTYCASNSTNAEDYIAKKHGLLYKKEFLRTYTILNRFKSATYDLIKKIIGKPNY